MDACYLIYSTLRLSAQNCIIPVLAYLAATTYQDLCYWCQSLAQGCECDQLYPEINVSAVGHPESGEIYSTCKIHVYSYS